MASLKTDSPLHDPRRALTLVAAENVRDLGGYATHDGSETQWRRFVRAGDMHELTPADRQALIDYGVTTVIDLRMTREVERSPNAFTATNEVALVRHDFWGTRFDSYRSKNKTAAPAVKLADLYCAGLVASGFVMAEIMATLADSPDTCFAFHCRSGKDRTGLVAALLLATAGVPEDTICADYALTAQHLRADAINPIQDTAPGAWQRGCEPETMERTFEFLNAEYGGVRPYLLAMGVTIGQLDRLRQKLLTA